MAFKSAKVRSICGYLIAGETPAEEISPRVDDLFADPIIEVGETNTILLSTPLFSTPETAITVGFKPGVTDNPGKAATDGFKTLFPGDTDARISTYTTYAFYGVPTSCDATWLAATLHNGLIERALVASGAALSSRTVARTSVSHLPRTGVHRTAIGEP